MRSPFAGLLFVAASYLVGAIPFGLLATRAATGRDVRKEGSGNIGASNVFRVAGPAVAAVVLALDMLKGAVVIWAARRLAFDPVVAAAAGVAAIAGHNWSVFLRGGGGKGIATSYGVLLALSPLAGGIAAVLWILVAVVTRYASLASLLGMLSVPVVMWVAREPADRLVLGVIIVGLAFYRHRGNIARLRRGDELQIAGVRRA